MQVAKQWLKQNKFLPKLSLKEQKEVIIALLGGEMAEFSDPAGNTKKGLRLYVVHNKELKTILTASYQLIQKLADIQEGSVIKIKRKYINEKTIYEVEVLKEPSETLEQLMPYMEKLKEFKKDFQSEVEKTKEEVEKEIEKEIEQKAIEESF